MTEYDYSPDAIERHLAKQAAIANWVDKTKQHEPSNPFVKLPDERVRQYPQHQQVYPQAALDTKPQGLNSPTYSSAHASTSSTKKKSGSHRTSSRHSSSSHSLHPSSTSTTLPSPRSPPPLTTSYFISPPTSPNGTSYLMPQTNQLPSLMQSASVVQQHPYPLPAGFSTLAIQPTPNQPVVVPINGGIGGYVVVPAQGVTIVSHPSQYQNPQHNSYSFDSGSERGAGGSFFGSLNHKNPRRKNKLKKPTRTKSY